MESRAAGEGVRTRVPLATWGGAELKGALLLFARRQKCKKPKKSPSFPQGAAAVGNTAMPLLLPHLLPSPDAEPAYLHCNSVPQPTLGHSGVLAAFGGTAVSGAQGGGAGTRGSGGGRGRGIAIGRGA